MYEPSPGFRILLQTDYRRAGMEARLVLTSVGMASEVVHHDRQWYLIVRTEVFDQANEELRTYERENTAAPTPVLPTPIYGGALNGVLGYGAVLIVVALIESREFLDLRFLGNSHAEFVIDGHWWRVFTALTLHADVEHLAGNLVFGALFGFFAGRLLGGGVAWLGVLIAGAIGNYANALLQDPDHQSIGASTAVFAALGMLVAHALRAQMAARKSVSRDSSNGNSAVEPALANESLLRRWSPLIGGVALLGFTGVGGERTDVGAHVTGFFAGILIGWACSRLPRRWLSNNRIQVASGVVCLVILTFAWWSAIGMVRV